MFLAELERLRQHAGAIQEICESTALVVATSQAGILEEDLLRISGELTGHRYLFGLLAPGGLLCDLPNDACREGARTVAADPEAAERTGTAVARLQQFSRPDRRGRLRRAAGTRRFTAWLGPVARASGLVRDLRRAQPYLGYETFEFDVPSEQEGDGYARLRVLFAEARQSVRIMEQAVAALQGRQRSRTASSFARARRWAGSKRRAAERFIGCGWTKTDGRALPGCSAVVRQLARLPPRRGEIRVPGLSRSCSPLSICPWPRTTGEIDESKIY